MRNAGSSALTGKGRFSGLVALSATKNHGCQGHSPRNRGFLRLRVRFPAAGALQRQFVHFVPISLLRFNVVAHGFKPRG